MTSSKNSVLKDVVAYVDAWSYDKRANYSNAFIPQLEEMGAEVAKRFNKRVTHVVFSNGHQATWRKAKKMDVQLVSLLWVGRCYEDGVRVDEKLFPALNDDKNPVAKNRRHRCMLPKDSPKVTTENNWRLKKKFEKMVKDLPLLESPVVKTSPVIIDHENLIIYSPGLKRSEYMAQRLKDMKDQRENISPTASEIADPCSPTGLKPSLGSTPTFLEFNSDDEPDDDSVSEPGGSPAEKEERSSEAEDQGRPGRDPTKPWLSPCHDVPKANSGSSACLGPDDQEDKEAKKQTRARRTSVRKKALGTIRSGDFSQSPVQDPAGKSRKPRQERRQSCVEAAEESENEKAKITMENSCTGTDPQLPPKALKSLAFLSSSTSIASVETKMSNESSPAKKPEMRTPKRASLSISSLVQSFTLSSGSKNIASSSTNGDNDVFEDYFSPSNHKRPGLPYLAVKRKTELPFELDPLPKKRKTRKESLGSAKKKVNVKDCEKPLNHESGGSGGVIQGDLQNLPPVFNNPAGNVKQVTNRGRRTSLDSSSTGKTTEDEGKKEKSGNPPLESKDIANPEQQENSDFSTSCRSSESGGNERTVTAGFTEIASVAEENHNKQAGLSLQKMVNTTKAPRTLVMTSMPTEKQQTVVQVVKALGGFSIVDRVCENTTHVVSGGHRRTLNILLGIARGCWILSFEWILWCLEQRQWIPEEPYELSDQFPAAQICRLQRHLSAGEHQQDLFQDQPAMFVSQRSQPPTQSLVELIELCGGTACKTVRQAGICIGKYSGRRPEGCRILSEQWVLDSITNLKILPYDDYDLE